MEKEDSKNEFDEISQKVLAATKKVVMSSSKLPSPGPEYSLNLSVPAVRNNLMAKRRQILNVIQEMLTFLNVNVSLSSLADVNQWQDDADVEDFLDLLVDANDHVFEQIGEALDTAAGLKKETPELIIVGTSKNRFRRSLPGSGGNKANITDNNAGAKSPSEKQGADMYRLIAAKVVERPQLKFADKIDNSNSIFVPKLKKKPFALRSLEDSFVRLEDGEGSFQNPYSFELQSFVVNDKFVSPTSIGAPKPIEETQLVFVDHVDGFTKMLKDLSAVSEIAVDLEHHSYRTFLGITCLAQISSREKDYIIDTLALRAYMHKLLEIFANPSILKVFHGADSDITWLQRDFGIYVVNLFDTYRAAKALGYPKLSLAFLLERYLGVNLDKRYQLADWRIRPLPDELMKYAQSDTHYLLHVADLLKQDLIDRVKYESSNDSFSLIRSVFDDSTTVCALHYEKPLFTDESYLELYERSRKVFNSQQLMALKLLFAWRDKMARREDESTGYVLPNHMLLQMAELLPKEPTGVLACCQPIPPLVKQNVHEMHGFILQARRQPLEQVENPAVAAAKTHLVSLLKQSPELEALTCPLDKTAKLPEEKAEKIVVEVVKKAPSSQSPAKKGEKSPKKAEKVVESGSLSTLCVFKTTKPMDKLLRATLDLFKGYVLRSKTSPQFEMKPTVLASASVTAMEESPKKRPVKRSASSLDTSSSPVNLHLVPISDSRSGRKRHQQDVECLEPLMPAPKTRNRRKKQGRTFVENVPSTATDVIDLEEGEMSRRQRSKQHRGSGKGSRRRDFHEKNARQQQTFSSRRK